MTDQARHARLRVGVVADMVEERWVSMDLVADRLLAELAAHEGVQATRICPALVRRLTRLPFGTAPARADILDRLASRYWDVPRRVGALARQDPQDLYHVIDHSYAHVVHHLPAERTIVTCHDADAFLPLIEGARTSSSLPRAFARRTLTGMQRCRHVICDSAATRDELLAARLMPADRMTVVHNGVDESFSAAPDADADARLAARLGPVAGRLELLHLGTTIPRKRIDLLLHIVAALRGRRPDVRLLKAGGRFTAGQQQLVETLGLGPHITQLPFLETPELAALYRRAAVAMVTSEREGFGLPIIEALACGTPVVATDLPVHREIGGDAARYAALGDVPGWCEAVLDAARPPAPGERSARLAQAGRYRWSSYAAGVIAVYAACMPAGRRPGGVA